MNKVLITSVFFIILILPLKAQYPWEKITSIDYRVYEVFKVNNYLIAYSGQKVLLSENQSNYWEVIENFEDLLSIRGLAYSDSLLYILLRDYDDFSWKIAHLTMPDFELSINECIGIGSINGSGSAIVEIIFKDGFLFAGDMHGRAYRSGDGGLNWIECSNGLVTGNSTLCNHSNTIYEVYSDGDKLFVGTSCEGIFSSINNGDSWQQINIGIPMETATTVYHISGNNEKVYAVTSKGVYFSGNAGELWQLDDNVPWWGLNIEVNKNNLLIPNEGNIYISNDNGVNWDFLNQNLSPPTYFPYDDYITSDSNNFFIVDKNYGMCKLSNLYTTLEIFSYGITQKHAKYLFIEDSLLLSATENTGLYYSFNSGDAWEIIENSLVNIDINAIEKFDTLLIAATDSGIFSSSDNGIQWINDISFYELSVNSIISFEGNLYVGTINGIYKGNIGTWNELNSGITDLEINYLYAYENYLYACTNNGAYLLDADNEEWNKLIGIPDESITSITQNNSKIYIAIDESIYYSENDGNTWSTMTIGDVNSINFLTNIDTNAFAVTDKGIYLFQSNDDWLNLYIDHNSCHLVVLDSLLFVSTEHGIYKTIFNESLVLGLDNIDNNDFIDIYPNPFSSILKLKVVDVAMNQINIFNMSGRLEYSISTKSNGSEVQLDLGNLKNGIYSIQINDGKSIITRKIIKVNN